LEGTFKGHQVQPFFAKLKKVFVIMSIFLILGGLLWPFPKFSAFFLWYWHWSWTLQFRSCYI